MKRLSRKTIGLMLAMALQMPVALAADPMADAMRNCGRETDAERRLACFDALVAKLPRLEADQFGMTSDIAHKRDPEEARQAKPAVLPGTITALRQGPQGQWIFTLDNQQQWIQVEVESGKYFTVGEAVHIEHGAMGTLWLAADKGRKTKVRRLS